MKERNISRRSFVSVTAMTALATALDWRRINAYAAKMGPMKDYPTVVIGAGLGGLCCGAYLAKQGVPVTVVEQHSNASALATFKHMLPKKAVPPDYVKKLEGFKPSISSFIVWLGLNRELRGKIKGCGIHVSSGRGPEADYQREKTRWADILIRRAEKEVIPGLSSVRERISQTEAQLHEEQIKSLTLEKKTLETHLRFLQAQIEPHFLFNTLSNILSLLESDPVRGKAMLGDLTRYLRSSLSGTRDRMTTLGPTLFTLGWKRFVSPCQIPPSPLC